MENLEKFYNHILDFDFLIRRGYFDIPVKRKKNEYTDLYPMTDEVLFDYFNLNQVTRNEVIKDYILTSLKNSNKESATSPIIYTVPKKNHVRRVLKYPNFYSYCELAKVIVDNKKEIIDKLISNKHSMSKFFNQSPYKFERTHRMQNYLLIGHSSFYKTDFSNFYHSFYTHAISWLSNGKIKAKSGKRTSLGDKLDRKIELEQNMETHGVPTGNLSTRIVMEYCMSFFDQALEERLNNTKIDFYRYVDDFYFGYDRPEDLITIERVMRDLTREYEITINENKSTKVTYNEITRSSQLLNYFSNIAVTDRTTVQNYLKIYNQYYAIANEEIISGVKGSNKLIFSSLQYFLKGLTVTQFKKAMQALVYISDEYEYPFFLQLFQLVLNDSRVSGSFLNLFMEIQRKEDDIQDTLVTDYFKFELSKGLIKKMIDNQLVHHINNHENEEAYFIILLLYRLDYKLSLSECNNILKSIKDNFKDIDDFSLLLLLNNYFENIQNCEIVDVEAFNCFLKSIIDILGKDYSKWFSDEHWLIKYELMYGYNKINVFKRIVDEFYSKRTNEKNIFSKKVMQKISKDQVAKFYFGLLDQGYSFTTLTEKV